MRQLSDQEIEKILYFLKGSKPLPEEYKSILFDAKKEYELIYADKEREEDILADTMAVPLQKVKTFRNGKNDNGWVNMLIFGDNLQVLKTLLQIKQEGKLKNADGTPGVRLVYIDPPFATRQEFRGSQDQKAYQDKIAGAGFLEFLRKRLVFLQELLSEDGNFFVHLDNRRVHYIKLMMDEILGETNFVNEIVWHKGREGGASRIHSPSSAMPTEYQNILIYAKRRDQRLWNPPLGPYKESTLQSIEKDTKGWFYKRGRMGRTPAPWEIEAGVALKSYVSDNPKETKEEVIQRLTSPSAKYVTVGDVWNNELIKQSKATNYPTEKPEDLLRIIVEASSNPGDLVLDCFAGSGTTLAVAEKFGRRWIGVDCGKLAIYTMQKRLLNIAESKDLENPKKKYSKPCKPFTLYNAGLYDYKMIKELPWEQYRDFALKLFQCRDEKHEISKIELDGYLGADHVLVFNYQKHENAMMGRDFIDDLHRYLEDRIGRRFFIIAPAASVQFLEDYFEKGNTKYFILRIPYSIIEEIHNRGFTKIKQPVSEMDVNDTVDAVGFDFIQVPTVECKYFIDDKKGQLGLGEGTKECVIKIERFESKIISRKPLVFTNLETLSMVMLDFDFDGEVFDLDEVFYAEELKKNGYQMRFVEYKVKEQIMIIYIDIFGNEKREVKTLADFKNL
ncbi:MAG: site-specific DNA-methyltransferase [Actinobacteria bacterium]|nr:site-specific DNA-methyltransferase [Actinomycetota bacterium]